MFETRTPFLVCQVSLEATTDLMSFVMYSLLYWNSLTEVVRLAGLIKFTVTAPNVAHNRASGMNIQENNSGGKFEPRALFFITSQYR